MGLIRTFEGQNNVFLGKIGIGTKPEQQLTVAGGISSSNTIFGAGISSGSYLGKWRGEPLSSNQVVVESIDLKTTNISEGLILAADGQGGVKFVENTGSGGSVNDIEGNLTVTGFISAGSNLSANSIFAASSFISGGTDLLDIFGAGGAAGGVGGAGTINKIPKFTASSCIGDSLISELGTTIEVNGNLSARCNLNIDGDSTILGNLSVHGDMHYIDTNVSVTSALSVVNTGTGPALFVRQDGTQPIAHFIDKNGGDIIFADDGKLGVGTFTPGEKISVVGNISASGVLYSGNNLCVNADNPTNAVIGQSRIGNYVGDNAYFSHFDNGTSTNYAVKQNASGATGLNAKSGQCLFFNINNTEQVHVSDGVFGPQTDSDVDLGTTGVRWKSGFLDNITVGCNATLNDVSVGNLDVEIGNLCVCTATDASSSSTGAVQILGGVGIAKKLYVGTNLDVDGTANLDAVDIDGAVQIDNTVTVGVDDTGYDVKFFGDTASAYMLWDASEDDLILGGAAGLTLPESKLTIGSTLVTKTGTEINAATDCLGTVTCVGAGTGLTGAVTSAGNLAVAAAQTGITSILATDIKIGEDDQTKIDFEDTNTINFYTDNEKQLILTDGALTPGTDDDVDLGSASLQFRCGFFDGTVELDNIKICGSQGANGQVLASTGSGICWHTPTTGDITGIGACTGLNGTNLTGPVPCLNIDAAQTGITSILATDLKIGEDDETKIDFETADEIHFYAANAEQVYVADGIFGPRTDSDVDLGTSGVRWKDTYVDKIVAGDITITDSTISDSGDFTLDVEGDITIDANGGDICLKDNGTEFGRLRNNSSNFVVESKISNQNLIFCGNDGGVQTVALTLNSSDAGTATFNNKVCIGDCKLVLNGTAVGATGTELNQIHSITDGTVAANKAVIVDTNKDITGFRNVTLTGELDAASLDIEGDADINGTTNLDAVDIDGAVQIDNTVTVGVDDTGYDVKFFGATASRFMMWDESEDALCLTDSTHLKIGDDDDLQIYHSGGHNFISAEGGAGSLYIRPGSGNTVQIEDKDGQDMITAGGAGAVNLYYNNSKKLETTNTGIDVTGEVKGDSLDIDGAVQIDGTLTVGVDDTGYDVKFFGATAGSFMMWDESEDALCLTDSTPLKIGDSGDLQIYHDGSHSYIDDTDTGDLILRANDQVKIQGYNNSHNMAVLNKGDSVDLYFNNSKKLETTNTGIDVTGEVKGDSLDIDGASQLDGTVTVGVDDTGYDVKFFGDTASAYMLWDASEDDLILGGAAGLCVAGNVDIDGTTNLDAVDIDGNVQLDGTLTVGCNTQGKDVKLFGLCSGVYMCWCANDGNDHLCLEAAKLCIPQNCLHIGGTSVTRTAAQINAARAGTVTSVAGGTGLTSTGGTTPSLSVDAAQTGITSILATDLKIGEDDETKIDFETADEIHFYANNTEQVYLGDNIFGPQSDSDVDLGTNLVRWKDAYVDKIVAGHITINSSTISDGGTMCLDAGGDIKLDAAGNDVCLLVDGTAFGKLRKDGSDNFLIQSLIDDKDIKFCGSDNGSAIAALTLDMSEAGAATFNNKVIATELDISGDVDIDGDTCLDSVQIDGTVTVGVDDTGSDVKFFGDTASAYMLWDASEDDLILGGDAGLKLPESKLTIGNTLVTSTAANLNLLAGCSALPSGSVTSVTRGDGILNSGTSITSTGTIAVDTSVIRTTGAQSLAGIVSLTNTTDSSNTTTGALKVTGGVGIAKKLYVGTDLNVASTGTFGGLATGDLSLTGDVTTALNVDGAVSIGDTTDSTSKTSGSLVTSGGVGIGKKLFVGTDLDVDGTTNLDAVDIDGNVQIDGTVTVGVDDTGYDVKFFGDTASAYMLWDASEDDLILGGAAGLTVAGNVDVDGTTNLDAVDIDGNVQLDGTLTVGCNTQGKNVKLFGLCSGAYMCWCANDGNDHLCLEAAKLRIPINCLHIGGTSVTSSAAELNLVDGITAGTVAASKAVIVDSNKDITGFRNVTLTGELDAASLDIEGDADINGTTNLDAVDIDGAVQIDSTVTVGVDDTGYDVKFFGDTASAYMLWDASEDDLILGGAAGLCVAGNADIDGTLEADAITVNGSTLASVIQGTVVTTAQNATNSCNLNIADNESTDENDLIPFIADAGSTGNVCLESDGDFHYNPSSGTVTATVFKGNIDAVHGDFDGTLEADAITVGGTALATVIANTTVTDAQNATNSCKLNVADNESTNEDNLIPFIEGGSSAGTGNVAMESDGDLHYNPSTGKLTATQLAGTLQTAAQTNITSLGTLTTLDVNGTANLDAVDIDGNVQLDGTLTVGVNDTGYDVQFFGATADRFLKWDESENALCLTDNTHLKIGDGDDLQIYHSGGHNFISAEGGAGSLYIRPGSGNTVQIEDKDGQDMITAAGAGGVNLYYNNSVKIQTTTDGVCVTGDVCASGNGYFDCVIAGGYFEEKAANDELAEYETGSLVVIGKDGKLILSTKRNDKNVFGVTQKGAKQPIVLGAEPVLVTGEIKIGDYITTSNKPGHGERSTNTIHGTIIAQALESGNGESHIVKAMVRKM